MKFAENHRSLPEFAVFSRYFQIIYLFFPARRLEEKSERPRLLGRRMHNRKLSERLPALVYDSEMVLI